MEQCHLLAEPCHLIMAQFGIFFCCFCDTLISRIFSPFQYVIGDGMKGHADGPFVVTRFNSPQGLAYSSEKNCVFVCDTTNHVIRCIDLTKFLVSTIAGNGNQRQNSYQGSILIS